MVIPVSDFKSNAPEQIEHAVKVIGKQGGRKFKVFCYVYRGQQKWKTSKEVSLATGIPIIGVLDVGKKLGDEDIITVHKKGSLTSYGKISFYSSRRNKIIALVNNPKKLLDMATKRRPQGSAPGKMFIKIKSSTNCKEIFIDDIDTFKKIKTLVGTLVGLTRISEKKFKKGIQKIIGEKGKFQDWGGEQNDLMTTRIKLKGKRLSTAFAFKGPGQTGILTIKKLGKNGDQIPRLFNSPAQLYVVQYWGRISDAVRQEMKVHATYKSIQTGEKIFYCIIDGQDSTRILKAYPGLF